MKKAEGQGIVVQMVKIGEKRGKNSETLADIYLVPRQLVELPVRPRQSKRRANHARRNR